MSLSYRVEIEDGHPLVWIDRDGYPVIRQPHHPNAYMLAPWESVEEAEAWAESEVARMTEAENAPATMPAGDVMRELAALREVVEQLAAQTTDPTS